MSADLRTRYLGFELEHPFVAAASPLTGDVATLERLREAGAAAVVLPSLFEEQIEHDEQEIHRLQEYGAESFPEALDYFPELDTYNTGPDAYLRRIEDAKSRIDVPVCASLNGSSTGGWIRYAKLMEEAGADALELNVYHVEVDPTVDARRVEERYVELVRAVRASVTLPLAVKIGPGFSAPANLALQLVEAGADGLVLFNRLLRPDIDLDTLQLVPSLVLSDSYAARLPLQWIAVLRDHTRASLAASGGVHTGEDAVKLLLAGADVTTSASALLRRGTGYLRELIAGLRAWLDEREYASVEQMKGSMSLARCPDPKGYQRASYMKALVSYTGELI